MLLFGGDLLSLLCVQVMAMIFESYKKNHGEKKRSGANSVLGDLSVICHHMTQYFRWKLAKTDFYVTPSTVLKVGCRDLNHVITVIFRW